jgi:hypothetical protein
MVRAAARRAIDFSEADPRDRRWWLRLRLVLDELEADTIAAYHRLHYDYTTAVLGRSDLREDSYRRLTKDAEERLHRIVKVARPWDDVDPARTREAEIDSLRGAWEAEYGAYDAPETQAAIAETVQILRRMMAKEGARATAVRR